ncbi:hypothetical protein [Vogesella indigofera]|uniref:Uncharacterized protein n=1 Tax=Vogesella indigofera TaxID=45465 RepID=A0ABT5I2I5_VOGIN|nr:hypothetical protein [Vogesella indigofera]MDC7690377.1 hypothetical protein [Vogesella indigofera]
MSKFNEIAGSLAKTKNIPVPLVDATKGVFDQVAELARIREIEQTKREEIAAKKETAIAAINSQKEIILECMRGTFAERAAALQASFKIIDRALESNDVNMLNAALASMVQVIQTSPFQTIKDVIEAKGTLRLE